MQRLVRQLSGKGASRQNSHEEQSTQDIDEDLKKERRRELSRLLLLGTGDSGKSTVLKQMQIIHCQGFAEKQRIELKPMIRSHCFELFRDLVEGAKIIGLFEKSLDVEKKAFAVTKGIEDEGLQPYATQITELWHSPELKAAHEKRGELHLSDSTSYFLGDIERFCGALYIPTHKDIVMCRTRTTGVTEITFEADGVKFQMVDVGGQRNERRKWIHCFENVHSVIFVVALSEYDQVLFEDDHTNRLHEAINLFAETIKSPYFAKTPFVLFLNKKDLFEEKIQDIDLAVCFPEYAGGCHAAEALAYIKGRFLEIPHSRDQEIFVHITTATSTHNLKCAFDFVREAILVQSIASFGML